MRTAALEYFATTFNDPFEGRVYTMYQDAKGLLTVGLGDLIDPIQLGWALPWRHRSDGSLASQSEYIAEWNIIKGASNLATDGWQTAATLCKLCLSPDDVTSLVKQKIEGNEHVLRSRLPGYDDWCCDAQVFIHSMAWADGPNMRYPRMFKLLTDPAGPRFLDAINECDINPKKGTIILRNAANRQLLTNAFYVHAGNLDKDVLVYPGSAIVGQETFDHTVMGVQHALALIGFNIKQDGIPGPLTTAAIIKFQGIHGLTKDGLVGPATYEAIQKALTFR